MARSRFGVGVVGTVSWWSQPPLVEARDRGPLLPQDSDAGATRADLVIARNQPTQNLYATRSDDCAGSRITLPLGAQRDVGVAPLKSPASRTRPSSESHASEDSTAPKTGRDGS
jgi:hypothetical protein